MTTSQRDSFLIRVSVACAERSRAQQHAHGQRLWMRVDAYSSRWGGVIQVRAWGRRQHAGGLRFQRAERDLPSLAFFRQRDRLQSFFDG